jgi:anti-anti-sigma factor
MAPDSLFRLTELEGDVTRVSLEGEIDLAVESRLREALAELSGDGRRRLLIDLTDVTFIDSAGLGVLLDTAKRFRRGRFVVACPDKAMRGMFELVGLNLLIPVDGSVDDALHHIRPRRRSARRPQTRPEQPSR